MQLRKLLAIVLLALLGQPMFVSPLLAVMAGADAGLPACCRRNGRHHCMEAMAKHGPTHEAGPELRAPREECPYLPAFVLSLIHPSIFAPAATRVIFAEPVVYTTTGTTSVRPQVLCLGSNRMRGPPVFLL